MLYGGQVHASVAKVLTEIYREEVLKLRGKDLGDKQSRTPEAHLVEHIVILHLWDDAHTLDEGGLVDLLFKNAPVQLTAHAMSFMARAACRQPPLEAKVRERMKALWEWRVRQVGGPDKMPKEELSGFGWWFACGAFDAGWAFGYLEAALKQTDIGHSRLQVFERLNEAFATHPQESLRCLRLFIDRNEDPWFCRGGRQQKGVWALLEQAIASSDSAIRDPAEDIVHLLGSKGYLEYRELLKTGPEGQS